MTSRSCPIIAKHGELMRMMVTVHIRHRYQLSQLRTQSQGRMYGSFGGPQESLIISGIFRDPQ